MEKEVNNSEEAAAPVKSARKGARSEKRDDATRHASDNNASTPRARTGSRAGPRTRSRTRSRRGSRRGAPHGQPGGQQAVDPAQKYVVDWAENDPEHPTRWSTARKWKNLWIVSGMTFITPLASSMFAPGVPQLMDHFKTSNELIASFVVSVYILGFAIGPIIIAPMSELYGRRRLYQVCNLLFLAFTVLCGESTCVGMLLAFRVLAGCAGVAPLTIGGGTIGDLMTPDKRAGAMAIFSAGPLLGPVVGPIAGGYIANSIGWRWVFRILAIGSFVMVVGSIFLDETYTPTLLEKRAAALRKEHSDEAYRSKFASTLPPSVIFKNALRRPLKLLFLSPIVSLLSLHAAFVYGLLYLLFTILTPVFMAEYGFSTGTASLTFLGLGAGSILGVLVIGGTSDLIYRYYTVKNGGEGKPEFRLPVLMWCSLFLPAGLFWFGWAAEAKVHYIVPILGTALIAFGMLSVMIPVQSYLVDAYTRYAASAIAASTLLRAIVGALLPLAGRPMYHNIGLGWGNSILGFLSLAMVPIPWVFWRYGEQIRRRMTIDLD